MNRLLAKSYDYTQHADVPPDYALLTQHSRDVATACDALARSVGLTALFNAGLEPALFERFRLTLRANGWMQDLGKANSHFQRMVTGKPQDRQLVRHETISGMLMLLDERFRAWLAPLAENLLTSVWGAIGHHRKFDESTAPEQVPALTVYVAHEDFAQILDEMSADLQLGTAPQFRSDLVIARTSKESCDLPARESIRDLQDKFIDREGDYEDEEARRMVALIKAFGIAADVAASAIAAREQSAKRYSLANFVSDSLKVGLSPDDLSQLISNWAWDRSKCDQASRGNLSLPPDFTVRGFQSEVAESDSFLTLAQAGCGSGKSLTAYMWARQWSEKFAEEGRKNFRLFFCLPTTGTTTEHFKDYALESGIDETLISLTHSRAGVDLKAIAQTAIQEEASEDEKDAAKAAQAALNAERDKIESLALWSTPLVVATADTVLGLMSNSRRAVYSVPAIMSGAIVFDEIHAFDDRMFGHLLVFLKNFPRLPVLLMTASLPEERRRAIAQVHPEDFRVISGPEEFETLERYLLKDSVRDEEIWKEIDDCVANGGKVLWVRNRVEWANESYEACRQRFAYVATNVYHSRFRYKDRSMRHRRVIDNFKTEGEAKTESKAAILVATQVAEMSLDLSADLLVTDIAPIPSLIQRMGRLNRRANPTDPEAERPPKPALIRPLPRGESNVELPYELKDIEQAQRWLGSLTERGRALSQRDLSEAFADFSDAKEYDIATAEERAVFFSGLWRTRPGMTRGEGYTVSVILEEDLKNCDERDKQGEPAREWLRRHEVAIPFKEQVMKWERVGTLRCAPRDEVAYDYNDETHEGTGARWLDQRSSRWPKRSGKRESFATD
ncbi:MAG TPA: CRISPR-associated helicase Cas3' [Pyrinomonadaceae bacterium]|nr:CRISPR-associated helicase Cas3' [Pyrinomonadaceae bacterium]